MGLQQAEQASYKHAQELEHFLTSGSDFHSCYDLNRRGLDAAGEERPGVIEARYNDIRNIAAFVGRRAAGEKTIVEAPLYTNGLSGEQRAAVSDDASGFDR